MFQFVFRVLATLMLYRMTHYAIFYQRFGNGSWWPLQCKRYVSRRGYESKTLKSNAVNGREPWIILEAPFKFQYVLLPYIKCHILFKGFVCIKL